MGCVVRVGRAVRVGRVGRGGCAPSDGSPRESIGPESKQKKILRTGTQKIIIIIVHNSRISNCVLISVY